MSKQTHCFKCGARVEAETEVCPVCGDPLTTHRVSKDVGTPAPEVRVDGKEDQIESATPEIKGVAAPQEVVLLLPEQPK